VALLAAGEDRESHDYEGRGMLKYMHDLRTFMCYVLKAHMSLGGLLLAK
jgi:hypothetical protein